MFTIWIFGREFSEHTVKDLLALPTSRTAIMSAKFIIVTSWCLALTGYLFTLALAVGTLLRLPGWSVDVEPRSARRWPARSAGGRTRGGTSSTSG